MDNAVELLSVVALTEDLSRRRLRRGQVGTVVQELADGVYEVEFCDNEGRAFECLPLRAEQFLVLRYEPAEAGSPP